MTDDQPLSPALLPAGLRDLLPPDAETEALAIECLMAVFSSHGYERVKPPLLEFEDSLLAGSGAAVAEQAFRLMDPDTHRMMGLRVDMTPQVARIAATRLVNAPRPLRLSYAGACVQLSGGSLSSDRQVSQAGIELIGPDSPAADAEMVAVGAEALAALALARTSFDLTMPPLAPTLIEEAGLPAEDRPPLLRALDRKDAAAVARYGGRLAGVLIDLLLSAGPAGRALATLRAAPLTPAARTLTDRLEATVAAIEQASPGLRLTVDPIEFRGWRYHTGVCVTVYAAGRHEELGRGGRYVSGGNEPACGLTLRTEALLRAAPPPPPRPRLFLPPGADRAAARRLRGEGYATVAALSATADETLRTATADGTLRTGADAAEARRLGCTHLLQGDAPVPLAS